MPGGNVPQFDQGIFPSCQNESFLLIDAGADSNFRCVLWFSIWCIDCFTRPKEM